MVDHVNAVRGVARWILRIVAITLAVIGIHLILKRLVLAVLTGSPSLAFQTWEGIGDGHAGARGVSMLVIATILALTGNRLVRWAIPVPPEGCPRCGHRTAPTDAGPHELGPSIEPANQGEPRHRCPECGLEWSDRPAARPRPRRTSSH